MKIIDNQKDYYDYVVGQFGCDDRLVYGRREAIRTSTEYNSEFQKIELLVGDYLYHGLYVKSLNKYLYGEDIKKYTKQYESNFYYYYDKDILQFIEKFKIDKKDLWLCNLENLYQNWPRFKFINTFILEPVYIGNNGENFSLQEPVIAKNYPNDYFIPYLKDFDIQSILSPTKAWISIENFLGQIITSKEKEMPVGDDKIRIVSAGFDLKTSFRNIKK